MRSTPRSLYLLKSTMIVHFMKETLTCSSIQIITTFKAHHVIIILKTLLMINLAKRLIWRTAFHFFHQNIKSLPKHQNELEIYLDSLNCNFSFIGLTETWLDESKEALHDISNYTCLHRYRQNRKRGGIIIAVRNGIVFKIRNDLEFFYSETESIFIEMEKTYLVLLLI